MSVDISNVVNVQLFGQATAAQAANVNVIGLFTAETAIGKVDNFQRATRYFTIGDVETDFGTTSQTYQFAQAFFGQQPNPVSADGYLVISHWRAVDFNAPATSGVLTGEQVSLSVVLPTLQPITDGSFDIDVDGTTENITNLDFATAGTLADIATIIDTALSGATATESDQKIIITSDTTGVTSLLTFATTAVTGTDISQILKLATGTGATLVQGLAAAVLTAESKLQAVTAGQAVENFISFGFIDNPIDADSEILSDYAQTQPDKMYWDVFTETDNLLKVAGNVVWTDIVLASNKRTQMVYKPNGNRASWLAMAARGHVVKFNAQKTANTLANKELKLITPDDISETDLRAAEEVGMKVYTTVKNVPNLFEAGRNSYFDDEYNTIALVDAIQTDSFNLLHLTNTKVPQTTPGLLQITDSIKKTLTRFVTNGVIAPGTWTLPDRGGDLNVFDKEIESIGYYVFPNPLSSQTVDERAQRKTPPIQVFCKFAGAFSSIDIILNINLKQNKTRNSQWKLLKYAENAKSQNQ